MSRPYIPGPEARRYQQLSEAQRKVVDRRIARIFEKRTGVKRKLDPDKDTDLVRKWLRIRDEVMSGKTGAVQDAAGAFVKITGVVGGPGDSRSGGWFEVESFRWGTGGATTATASSSGGGSTNRRGSNHDLILVLDTRVNNRTYTDLSLSLSMGKHLRELVLEVDAGDKWIIFTLSDLLVSAVTRDGEVTFNYVKSQTRYSGFG